MAIPFLNLPPEIILQILSKLPLQALLRFAQTSKYAHSLAYTDISALSLAVYPSDRDSWRNNIFAAQHRPEHDLHAAIQIPTASGIHYSTLHAFHNKLVASILDRHAYTLQKLQVVLWTLSLPIAKAIAKLPALRELSIRIETVQAVPREYFRVQRREESEACALLASNTSWAHCLHSLHIEKTEIDSSQLLGIIDGAKKLQTLRLNECAMLTSSIWDAARLKNLRHFSILECRNIHVNEMAVETISKLHKLEALDLQGCSGLDGEVLEQWNRDVWHVPVFVAPRPRGSMKEDMIIEVDPEYMLEVV